MKITSIEPHVIHVTQRGDWIFVCVHTDTGLVGLGEASHSGNDALLIATLQYYETMLTGQDPRQIQAIWKQLSRLDGGRIAQTALSAIEQALWDIVGQHLETPIHQLFGGAVRTKLRLYANINRHVNNRSPKGFALAAKQAANEGFTAIKLAPFDELTNRDHIRTGPYAAWRAGVERVRAVRSAVGDHVEIAVDCHGRMDASEALIVAQELAELNLFWYEEPVHHRLVDDLVQITQSAPMPTASCESIFGVESFAPFLGRRVVDVLMPDVKHDGGIQETASIAAAARAQDLLVAPHNPTGPIATAATAQVMSAVHNFYILEYAWGEVPWRAQLITPAERIEQGYLILSDLPGIGHKLNRDLVNERRAQTVSSADSTKVREQD